MFSFVPRYGLWGSAKKTFTPDSMVNWAWSDISLPRSQVNDFHNWIGSVVTFTVAVAMLMIPAMPKPGGFNNVITFFLVVAIVALAFSRFMPASGGAEVHSGPSDLKTATQIVSIASTFSLFFGIGMVYAFLFQIGLAMGASAEQTALGMSLSQIASFIGAVVAPFALHYVKMSMLHIVFIVVTIATVSLIQHGHGWLSYAIGVNAFNGLTSASAVLALSILAITDKSGKLIALSACAQTFGLAIGPAVVSSLLTGQGYGVALTASAWLLSLSAVLTVVMMMKAFSRPRASQVASS